MDQEKRALLDHAALCRRVAGEISHTRATERLLGMALEYERRALALKERQLEGIATAKAAGVYKGRPASIDPAQIQQLKAEGMGPSQIAKHLGIGRASVYRALEG
jgi:DNA invertase Pin-like site-specific DNA recombinase